MAKVTRFAELRSNKRISRRDFLTAGAAAGGIVALSRCAPAGTPSVEVPGTPTSAPTTAPMATATPGRSDLIVANWSEPQKLDGFDAMRDVEYGMFGQIYDSLCFVNWETGALEGMAAESWEQLDPLTYTFKLREGMQWHKGYGEVTAEDLAWTINKLIDEQLLMAFGWGPTTGASVVDKYTVKVELSSAWQPFILTAPIQILGQVMCKNAYEEMGPDEFGRNPIGSGPFQFKEWTSANEVIFSRNPDYWYEGRPALEELIYVPVPDAFVRMEKLKKGEVDWMDNPDLKDVPVAESHPTLTVASKPGLGWDYITFNLFNPDLAVSSKEVRQALAWGVDRNEIVESVYYGYALADDDPLCPGVMGDDPEPQVYPNTADVEKARALLSQAGLGDGFSIKCLTDEKPHCRRELEIVADQLSRIGVTVDIEFVDNATYVQRSQGGGQDFEMLLHDGVIASVDPDSALYWFVRRYGWDAPDVAQLLEDGRTTTDVDERTDIYRQVVSRVLDDCPWVYTCHSSPVYLMRKGVTGFYPTPQKLFPRFDTVSWEA